MQPLGEASDAQLITSVEQPSSDVLAEMYRRYERAVYNLARRVIQSASEAEDVTQEVFLRLWVHPDRFDPTRGSLRSFLLAQSHGRAVEAVQSLNARRMREARDAQGSTTFECDIDHDFWRLTLSEQLTRALSELPDEERVVIELAYFEGHTYAEVARILDLPEGTAKSRIRSGMRRMRAILVDAGIEGVDA